MIGAILRAAAVMGGVGYISIAALMYLYQDKLLYHPDPQRTDPRAIGLAHAEEVALTAADGTRLVAWYTPARPGAATILFLHGNGGSLQGRTDRYRFYTDQGFGVLFLSWRGYGGSGGTPSETGFNQDADAAYDFLMAQGVAPDSVLLVGESLGTGLAVQLAARKPVKALALEAPYDSAAAVAAKRYWWLPVKYLIKDSFDSLKAIAAVHVPLLIHHGSADRVIPIAAGRRLYAAANEPKQFIELKDATHDIFTRQVFGDEIEFFRGLMK
jgi:fermentation-respiration switch protein FrsA (DUF1100 family)